ncbi:MAG: vitamin K epoxide reductase family protein [Vicinamibacterales bacterium]
MGRKARTKKESTGTPQAASTPGATERNWPLLVLAVIGILLTSYILYTDYIGSRLQGCSVGSSCDIVLSSKWARLLGAPTAFWGFASYVTLAVMALRWRPKRWRVAWAMAIFGFCYSIYLTTVSLTILHAACPVLPDVADADDHHRGGDDVPAAGAAGVLVDAHRGHGRRRGSRIHPRGAPELHGRPRRAAGNRGPADEGTGHPSLQLRREDVRRELVSALPAAEGDVRAVGHAAAVLECSPAGQGQPQAAICRNLGITTYPTWIIDGKRTEEVMSFQQLAEATGFKEEAATPAP